MTSETYPPAMPNDLLDEVRHTAKAAGLSMAEAMRQSMKLGLPQAARAAFHASSEATYGRGNNGRF